MSEVPLYGWPLARSLGPLERQCVSVSVGGILLEISMSAAVVKARAGTRSARRASGLINPPTQKT